MTEADQYESRVESTYHLKWVNWNTGRVPIVMQRINGPCPLIAIMNVLLLREKVKLPPMLEQITAHQLMTYLGECIMDSVPADIQKDSDAMLNLEQNIHDAMEILPKLQTGLDVNVRFSGITDFEYTPECIIFDLLRIPLYHGWLSDPTDESILAVVGNLSYNQLVDSIITNKPSKDCEISARAYLAEDFLHKTASQLTTYGLSELKNCIKDNELGVLFRNNHFITLFKREGTLYQLVTDHGFLTENIVWETLENVDGDGKFVDCNFEIIESPEKMQVSSNQTDRRMQMLENDFLVALSLREEEAEETACLISNDRDYNATNDPSFGPAQINISNKTNLSDSALRKISNCNKDQSLQGPSTSSEIWTEEDDFEMAKRLQEEENRLYEEQKRAAAVAAAKQNENLTMQKLQCTKSISMQENLCQNLTQSANSQTHHRNERIIKIEREVDTISRSKNDIDNFVAAEVIINTDDARIGSQEQRSAVSFTGETQQTNQQHQQPPTLAQIVKKDSVQLRPEVAQISQAPQRAQTAHQTTKRNETSFARPLSRPTSSSSSASAPGSTSSSRSGSKSDHNCHIS